MLACIARRARQMRSIATDGVAWSVCVLVTTVSLAKTDEPIVMPFREQTRVGPQECIRWGHGSPNGNGTLRESVPDTIWTVNASRLRQPDVTNSTQQGCHAAVMQAVGLYHLCSN